MLGVAFQLDSTVAQNNSGLAVVVSHPGAPEGAGQAQGHRAVGEPVQRGVCAV